MRARPSSANISSALVAIAGAFWLLPGSRFRQSRGSHTNALRTAIVLLLTLLAFSLTPPSSSYAATTRTVCASGCNYTTIAAAIGAASPGDTISIQDAVHTEANITVDRNLTIQGQGATNTAVDGGGAGSVFLVNGGVTATIQDLTIRNGSAPSPGGGGILNSGTLTVNNDTVSGNTAYNGGGIWNYGSLKINNSTISGNLATPGGYGGGVITFIGPLKVSNSTISGNFASNFGGGILNAYGILATISNSTLSGNSTYGYGGGIASYGGATTTISNSTLSGNTAGSGGGISNYFNTATR